MKNVPTNLLAAKYILFNQKVKNYKDGVASGGLMFTPIFEKMCQFIKKGRDMQTYGHDTISHLSL
jgi:hypothetical protein